MPKSWTSSAGAMIGHTVGPGESKKLNHLIISLARCCMERRPSERELFDTSASAEEQIYQFKATSESRTIKSAGWLANRLMV